MIKLSKILKEVMEQEEQDNVAVESRYDKVIKDALKVDQVPLVKGKYKLGQSGTVDSSDMSIFKKLYPITPPKSDKEIGTAGTRGSGNGEIALYWLLQGSGYDVKDSRGKSSPDLTVNGSTGVEVKSSDNKYIDLGRYARLDSITNLLNSLFSIYETLQDVPDLEESPALSKNKTKTINSANFSIDNIKDATNLVIDFYNQIKKDKDLISIPVIKNLYNKIRILFDQTPKEIDKHSSETLSAGLLRILFIGILREKPGIGGYIANVQENGKIQYFKVTEESIKGITDDKILAKAAVNAAHSFLKIKPELFF
jgi:hypothetical protein